MRIGILGGGQLGRMMSLSASAMGYTTLCLDPNPNAPTAQVADSIVASFDDVDAAKELAARSDVVTYEFENIDTEMIAAIEEKCPQGMDVLKATQHRILEKQMIESAGLRVAPYVSVRTVRDVRQAYEKLGLPFVIKTCRFGYDGKGQTVIRSEHDLQTFAEYFVEQEYVAEAWLPFEKEISVIVTRGYDETSTFPISENIHHNNILHLSIVPARVSNEIQEDARHLALQLADHIGLMGTLAVELFVMADGRLYVNELAPRPHNSGHYTIDACETSQFEQHIRAVTGMRLGRTRLTSPVVMVNLLGEHMPRLHVKALPSNVKLHLYGKDEAKTGRKMGHLNVLGDTVEEALHTIEQLAIWKETVL
ncbi:MULTISPECIES: 5-(carboxyamino)imidazole ribonucleotide synthase [unclassified Exiguobacterium]|uniref:5-(carboxyamino)imidazole ribonucleotide synthase n=1 Tax=unclassified Exiguobacterium TaxID=2644629 RepID=UPI001BE984B2|nr:MULTISPECIES: 5-(carboxyamino)imidazole ribonucleotide synthase [unclassified Exiguobacterium]MCV9900943.1 5-(carboxyamino)imidazole ribonucleotide synthase [Exiguobacterium sp. N5]